MSKKATNLIAVIHSHFLLPLNYPFPYKPNSGIVADVETIDVIKKTFLTFFLNIFVTFSRFLTFYIFLNVFFTSVVETSTHWDPLEHGLPTGLQLFRDCNVGPMGVSTMSSRPISVKPARLIARMATERTVLAAWPLQQTARGVMVIMMMNRWS